jgi:hypothetical protein
MQQTFLLLYSRVSVKLSLANREFQSVRFALRSSANKRGTHPLRQSVRSDSIKGRLGEKLAPNCFTAMVADTRCMSTSSGCCRAEHGPTEWPMPLRTRIVVPRLKSGGPSGGKHSLRLLKADSIFGKSRPAGRCKLRGH